MLCLVCRWSIHCKASCFSLRLREADSSILSGLLLDLYGSYVWPGRDLVIQWGVDQWVHFLVNSPVVGHGMIGRMPVQRHNVSWWHIADRPWSRTIAILIDTFHLALCSSGCGGLWAGAGLPLHRMMGVRKWSTYVRHLHWCILQTKQNKKMFYTLYFPNEWDLSMYGGHCEDIWSFKDHYNDPLNVFHSEMYSNEVKPLKYCT